MGGTIQPIPHVTNEIRRRIQEAGRKLDAEVVIVEVGGTVGDMEGQPFLETISQMRHTLDVEETEIEETGLHLRGRSTGNRNLYLEACVWEKEFFEKMRPRPKLKANLLQMKLSVKRACTGVICRCRFMWKNA